MPDKKRLEQKKRNFKRVLRRLHRQHDNLSLDRSYFLLSVFLRIRNLKISELYNTIKGDLKTEYICPSYKDFHLLLKNDESRSLDRRTRLIKYLQRKINFDNVLVDLQRAEKTFQREIVNIVKKKNEVRKNFENCDQRKIFTKVKNIEKRD